MKLWYEKTEIGTRIKSNAIVQLYRYAAKFEEPEARNVWRDYRDARSRPELLHKRSGDIAVRGSLLTRTALICTLVTGSAIITTAGDGCAAD
jgi:hypothetical protein